MTVNKSFTIHPSYGNVGNIPFASVCSSFPASGEVQQLNPDPSTIGSLATAAFLEPVGLTGYQMASQSPGAKGF